MAGTIDIGQVVRTTGVPVSTLHVWERHGLIAPVGRRGLRRQYGSDAVSRIGKIRLLQQGGFSLREIAELLSPGGVSKERHRLEDKLAELRARREQLEAAITGIEHALSCAEPSPLECPHFLAMATEVFAKDDK